MRIKLVILAAAGSLALASASWAGVALNSVSAESTVHLVAAKKQTQTTSMAKFKANGGRAASTFPQGCVYGNDNVTRCTQICIASASGNMCADENTCYNNNGQVIACN